MLFMMFAGLSQAQVKRTYTVKAGDTLYRIAVNHNLTVARLQALNGIQDSRIRVGQMLRLTDGPAIESVETTTDSEAASPDSAVSAVQIPAQPAEEVVVDSAPTVSPRPSGPSMIAAVTDSAGTILYGEYAAHEGESLFDLAFGLGIALDTLLLLNPEHALVLADGAPVRVPGEFATLAYAVRPGDSLSRIAGAHGITLRELRSANPGSGNVIQVGQALQIPSAVRPSEATLPLVIAEGPASVYPDQFVGRLMASGAEYDADKFLLAHPTLPFGTIVLIENVERGTSTFAEVADRMPVSTQYVVEVSAAVAKALELSEDSISIRIIQSERQN